MRAAPVRAGWSQLPVQLGQLSESATGRQDRRRFGADTPGGRPSGHRLPAGLPDCLRRGRRARGSWASHTAPLRGSVRPEHLSSRPRPEPRMVRARQEVPGAGARGGCDAGHPLLRAPHLRRRYCPPYEIEAGLLRGDKLHVVRIHNRPGTVDRGQRPALLPQTPGARTAHMPRVLLWDP